MFTSILLLLTFIMFKSSNTEYSKEFSKTENTTQIITYPIGPNTPKNVNIIQGKTGRDWTMGIVPYYIDTISYDSIISRRVRMAMNSIEASSCVIFRHLDVKPSTSNQFNWLHFTNPSQERDCVHEPIYAENGEIIIVLGFECMQRREVVHALLHALGFKDEVSHPQRDQYIRILWENLQPKYRPLFRIQLEEAPFKMVEYDPMSVMHFHDRAFSSNGGATIAPLVPGLLISPSDNLSQLDIMKLRLSFGHECNKRKVGGLLATCKNVFHGDNNQGIDRSSQNVNVNEKPIRPEGSDNNIQLSKKGEPEYYPINQLSSESDTTDSDSSSD